MKDLEVLNLDTWKNEFTEEECNFDKLQEYLNLINECIDRFDDSRYSERHHVIPKCVDRNKRYLDQLVKLNGADHFLVHKKLIECFNGKLKSKLQLAVFRMVPQEIKYCECVKEDFEEARASLGILLSREFIGQGNPFYGKSHSKESIEKISYAKSHPSDESRKHNSEGQKRRLSNPKNHPMYGKKHSEESKYKMSKSHLNMSDETRKRMSESAKGNHAHLGCHHSEETRRILSLKSKGHIPPNKGKKRAINSQGKVRYFSLEEELPEGFVWVININN